MLPRDCAPRRGPIPEARGPRSRVGLHYDETFRRDFSLTSSYLRVGSDGAKQEHVVRFTLHPQDRRVKSERARECDSRRKWKFCTGNATRVLLVPVVIASAR